MLEAVFHSNEINKLLDQKAANSIITKLKIFLEDNKDELNFYKVDSADPSYKDLNCFIIPYGGFNVLISHLKHALLTKWDGKVSELSIALDNIQPTKVILNII